MYYFNTGYVQLGINILYKVLFAIAIIVLALMVFLTDININRAKSLNKYVLLLIIPYLSAIFISAPLWVITGQTGDVIRRGMVNQIYMILMVMSMAGILYVFGEHGAKLNLTAILAANGFVILRIIFKSGLVIFIKDFAIMLKTFSVVSSENLRDAEQHELTFSIGLYILYFIMNKNIRNKKSIMLVIVSLFFFITGVKRIAVLALLVSICIYIIFKHMSSTNKKSWIMFISFMIIFGGLFWIYLIKSGFYEILEYKFGINTMGREYLAEQYGSYYKVQPFFIGNGAGYVSRMFSDIASTDSFNSIQCDYLLLYLDYGFIGYFIWMILYLPVKLWYIVKWQGIENGVKALCGSIFICVTAVTDNTIYMTFLVATSGVLIMEKEFSSSESKKYNYQATIETKI
jgi:hypothetical protein